MNVYSLTWKGVICGGVFSVLIPLFAIYNRLKSHGSYMTIDFTTPAAFFMLFLLLVAINLLRKKTDGKEIFTPAELITVFVMMTISCSICTMGLVFYLIPLISGVKYFATLENKWAEVLHPYIKPWLMVQDSKALEYFFEGIPEGIPIPYSAWLGPLFMWLIFIVAFYLLSISISIILRKQWITREKLIYPLTFLPYQMCCEPKSFFRSKLMWLGFGITFLIGTIRGLHSYFPLFPTITLEHYTSIFRGIIPLVFRISFPMIGFCYLVNKEITFSICFFHFLYTIIYGYCELLGIGPKEILDVYSADSGGPIFAHLQVGAFLILFGFIIWKTKDHIRDVFLCSIGKKKMDDSGEILPYPVAFWLFIGSLLVMSVWLSCSGLSLFMTLFFILLIITIFVGLTRIVSESGLAETRAPMTPLNILVSGGGTYVLGKPGLAALGFSHIYAGDLRTFVMMSVAHGLKLIEGFRKKRILFYGFLISIFITLFVSIWATLYFGYKIGALNADRWFFKASPESTFSFIVEKMRWPHTPHITGLIYTIVGAVVMYLLMFMHYRFAWWPLHPIGLPVCAIFLTKHIWFSVFLAWLIKTLILKYGGVKMYRASIPFFMGLILGQFVICGIWVIIDMLTGKIGNILFWV